MTIRMSDDRLPLLGRFVRSAAEELTLALGG
jgi:hypothetical protein